MDNYNEVIFLNHLENAIDNVKKVISNTREPYIPFDVHHSYQDKFTLAEYLAYSSFSSIIECLQSCGLSVDLLKKLINKSKEEHITLRFSISESTSFDKKISKEEESKVKRVKRKKSKSGVEDETSNVIITTIDEYYWNYSCKWLLNVYIGNKTENIENISQGNTKCEIITRSKHSPRDKKKLYPELDLDITWILQHIDNNLKPIFSIDRTHKNCHTPSRNTPINETISCYSKVYIWATTIHKYINQGILSIKEIKDYDLSCINAMGIFNPVIPIFENNKNSMDLDNTDNTDNNIDNQNVIIPFEDIADFMAEQKKTLYDKISSINKVFAKSKYITDKEIRLLISLHHLCNICEYFIDGISFIESMLKKQLVSAIGKEISSQDLRDYMIFHNRKIFKSEYIPQPFSYSIRRVEHYPEGIISIESDNNIPISTMVRKLGNSKIIFPINAATNITCSGEKYIHGWVNHSFSDLSNTTLNLKARARQFSSFILLIGNVISSTSFNPQHGIIIQNKDDIIIPLLFEQIPTPKTFRDQIESLSPEQQKFAKAFRSMQLQSSLFGMCIIQIKPQIERLLNISPDSLTKEIKLTQDIMKLFIDFQVPSDLLSYKHNDILPNEIDQIKHHVESLQSMINVSKDKEIEDAKHLYKLTHFDDDDEEMRSFGDMRSFTRGKGSRSIVTRDRSRGGRGGRSAYRSSERINSETYRSPPRKRKSMASPSCTVKESNQVNLTSSDTNSQDITKPIIIQQGDSNDSLDIVNLPVKLDSCINEYDIDNSLHTTIIKPQETWIKKYKPSLLGDSKTSYISGSLKTTEKNQAFDLLDALSRSGSLEINNVEFHVVLASTHHFDKTLMDTIIQDNINPIEKLERSTLIISSTIHDKQVKDLINPLYLSDISNSSPHLLSQ